MKTVALKVPSVIVPQEWNVLFNPQHPQFNQCEIQGVSVLDIDLRLKR